MAVECRFTPLSNVYKPVQFILPHSHLQDMSHKPGAQGQAPGHRLTASSALPRASDKKGRRILMAFLITPSPLLASPPPPLPPPSLDLTSRSPIISLLCFHPTFFPLQPLFCQAHLVLPSAILFSTPSPSSLTPDLGQTQQSPLPWGAPIPEATQTGPLWSHVCRGSRPWVRACVPIHRRPVLGSHMLLYTQCLHNGSFVGL